MLEMILEETTAALRGAGLAAVREFPDGKAACESGAVVAVGLESCKFLGPGLGEYLGVLAREDGRESELFGKRLELCLRLEVFSTFSRKEGAGACMAAVAALGSALEKLPEGLKPLELCWEELRADERLGMYRCPCTLRCLAFLVAERGEEEAEFLDFTLKGRLLNGEQ